MPASVALAIFSRASGASRAEPRIARRAVAFRNRGKSKSSSPGYNGMPSLSVAFNHNGAAPVSPRPSLVADGSQQANPETKRLPTVALSPQGAVPIIPAYDG